MLGGQGRELVSAWFRIADDCEEKTVIKNIALELKINCFIIYSKTILKYPCVQMPNVFESPILKKAIECF